MYRGIVSIGYAGALREHCAVGDILLPDEIVSLPPLPKKQHHPDPEMVARARRRAEINRWSFHTGRMLTSHRVVCAAREKRLLGKELAAESVEMESGVLAELAADASLPFLVIRVVSDAASFSLPESIALMDHIRQKRIRSIARCLLTQPVQTFRFLQMMQHTRKASKSLTRILVEEILEDLSGDRVPVGGGEIRRVHESAGRTVIPG
jgi:nucleoside phosphorylase